MSIKITHIDMKKGDNVFLQFEVSAEHSISVRVTETRKFIVSGPMNCNGKTFEIKTSGIKRISKKSANK